VENIIIAILAVLAGLAIGTVGSYFGRKYLLSKRYEAARAESSRVLEEAEEQKRAILVEAKEEALKLRSAGEEEIREWRAELQRTERRLTSREENIERRAANLERREKGLAQKEKAADDIQAELEALKQKQLQQLETISNLSIADAKEVLMRQAEEEIQRELALRYRDMEQRARDEAKEKAQRVLATAIQRLASEVVSEATVTTVPLPSDDMKGRLIGREGRNIRAIEKTTGVDLIVDDTPEAVTLSCFDPIRREVARVAITKLIADGRIHPARIEEMVAKSEKEVEDTIWKSGEQAVLDTGVRGLHPDLIKLLGRLKYRYSYGENVLQHCIEVSHLAGMMAAEIGANVKTARAGGLLHDIGKALTHEIEGPHAEIGAEVAAKYEVSPAVRTCILEHHNDEMSTTEAFIVAAADAISAARPGARKDTVEQYMKRLEALEDVARAFDGVEKCFAIQAGREIRVMVKPNVVDDLAATQMARNIVKKIEESLVYPGQIKVMVIRESRAVEYAR
jgi:ribonuclease Y